MIYECLLLLSVQLSLVSAKYCYSNYGSKYCRYGCCGSTYDRYCCNSYVGGIAGGISGLVFLIAIIVVCCCCIRRRRAQQGTVVYGPGQPTTVISTVQYPPGFAQQPGFTTQPGAYSQPGALPHAGAYPQQPMSPGPYTQPPPATGNQPSDFKGYNNTGFTDASQYSNQTQQKAAEPIAPPPYEP